MRKTLSRGAFAAAAAATGMLSLSCSSAFADTHAAGATKDSPGVLSGNVVQVPVEAPVNACGNTVNGVAAFNGAFRNSCANTESETEDYGDSGYGDSDYGDSDYGTDDESPGGSPTPSPTEDCETPEPTPPPTHVVETPPSTPPPTRIIQTQPPADHEKPVEPPQLAETGSKTMLAASAASAALITGGVLMYRRGRTAFQR
ncbi:chaplin [Streptomyces sp. NPDC058676]|uniref:chaplin n=1 Tax=unclassified Streptomyces TaxID=2593676 RepID=UPI00365A60F1